MKKNSIFLFIALSLFGINCSSFAKSDLSSPVTQIVLTPKPHIQPMRVMGLPRIDSIYTAGQYGWAIDYKDGLVAFYNGKSWGEGQAIPGISEFSLYPSWPQTGTMPDAWVLGMNSSNAKENLVSYFNGTSWSPAQKVRKILDLSDDAQEDRAYLRVSGGYAFLLLNQTDTSKLIYSVYNPKTQLWSKANELSGVDLNSMTPDEIDVMNDVNPDLYLSVGYNKLYRINKEGKIFPEKIAEWVSGISKVIADGDDVYFTHTLSPGDLAFKHQNTDNTWHYTDSDFFPLDPSNINNGLLCKFIYDGTLGINCLDTKTVNPVWSPSLFVTTDPKQWNFQTRPNGAWVAYHLDSDTQVVDFDASKNELTDTNYPYWLHLPGETRMHSINPDQLIICSRNSSEKSAKPKLYYYDRRDRNKGWLALDTENINVNACTFSSGGNADHQFLILNAQKGETLWLYHG